MMLSTTGSPLKTDESTGFVQNGDEPDSNTQRSSTGATIWTPFGRGSASPAKTYKPVTFSPSSSASQSSIVMPVMSSSSPSASVSQNTTRAANVGDVNGVELKIINDDERIDDNSKELLVPSSTINNTLPVAPSSKISTSAVIWKPPSSPDLRSTSPDSSRSDLRVSTPPVTRRWKPVAVFDAGSNRVKLSTDTVSTKDASSIEEVTSTPRTNTEIGLRVALNNDIIQEWRSGFCDDKNRSDRTMETEYDTAKGDLKVHQHDPVSTNIPADNPPVTRTASEYQPGMKEQSLEFASPDSNTVPVKFDGIGSTDETTGVPFEATRASINEQNSKDCNKSMNTSLHKPERESDSDRPVVKEVENRSPTTPVYDHPSCPSPLPRYDPQPYRSQPRRIEDYEPGCHSSLAPQVKELDHRKIVESDAEVDYRNADAESFVTRSEDGGQNDNRTQGPRKKEVLARSVRSNSIDRTQSDEKSQRRRKEIEAVMARERHRRFLKEQKQNETRRHRDTYTLSQKRSVLLDRFNNLEVRGSSFTHRPKQISAIERRGKARALYPFQAQNDTELSFAKGDIICLLRKIDSNWYQGERNGVVGIIPVAYVEVITALEEADSLPLHGASKAIAKFDFRAKTSSELELHRGDTVTLIRKVDRNWYEGCVGNRKGLFPVSFVEVIQDPETTPFNTTSKIPDAEVPVDAVSSWNSERYEKDFKRELRRETSNCPTRLQNGISSKSLVLSGKQASSCEALWKPGNSSCSTLPTAITASKTSQLQKDLIEFDDDGQTTNSENVPTTFTSMSLVESTGKVSNPKRHELSGGNLDFDVENERQKLSKKDSSVYPRYLVLYDYKPNSADELELKEGDFVRVQEKCEDGWFVGFSETNDEFGTFPGNYVQPVSSSD